MRDALEAHLVEPGATAWTDILAQARHDFYHLPEYVAVSALNDGGEPRGLIVADGERQLLLPLVVRPVEDGLRDASSPYGYPGPVQTGEPDAVFEARALLSGIELLRDMGMVSLFVRMHPLLNPQPPADVGLAVRHGDTVAVDLTLSEEDLWKQTRRNHRQQIKQALRKGYVVEFDEDWTYAPEFESLYRATMERRSADAYYHFSSTYFDSLREALGDRLHLAVAVLDDTVTAAAIFAVTGDIVQMHLTGHDEQFAADQPMKLLFHEICLWARRQGHRVLHLGGGRGGAEDSLLHFKAGFSPLRHPYHTLRVVIEEAEYARLVGARDRFKDPAELQRAVPAYRDG